MHALNLGVTDSKITLEWLKHLIDPQIKGHTFRTTCTDMMYLERMKYSKYHFCFLRRTASVVTSPFIHDTSSNVVGLRASITTRLIDYVEQVRV